MLITPALANSNAVPTFCVSAVAPSSALLVASNVPASALVESDVPKIASLTLSKFATSAASPMTSNPTPVDASAILNTFNAPVDVPTTTLYAAVAAVSTAVLTALSSLINVANCCTPLATAVAAVTFAITLCKSSFSLPNNAAAPWASSKPEASACVAPTAASNLNVSDARIRTRSLVSPI